VLLLQRCLENFENERYLFTDEKHRVLRVSAVCLYLMDDSKQKLGSNKKVNISQCIKLFKVIHNL
jgi:hypothetical protein